MVLSFSPLRKLMFLLLCARVRGCCRIVSVGVYMCVNLCVCERECVRDCVLTGSQGVQRAWESVRCQRDFTTSSQMELRIAYKRKNNTILCVCVNQSLHCSNNQSQRSIAGALNLTHKYLSSTLPRVYLCVCMTTTESQRDDPPPHL